MDAKEFHALSAKALEHIDAALGEVDPDGLDVQLGGDVLTITFADGSRFVINAHSAAGQVWMAAGTTAWHFDWEGERWVARRTGDELMATVAKVVGAKLGTRIAV
jgi:iron-sulfur cluster assembly protein CyaY